MIVRSALRLFPMLLQILSFLLNIAAGFLSGACLLRLYMQWQRVSFVNPLGQFVLALTNWMVLPLRKWMSWRMAWDMPSLVVALLVQLLHYVLLWLLWIALDAFAVGRIGPIWLPWLASFGLARVAVSGLMGLLIVYVVLSWVQVRSPVGDVVVRLAEPLLRPVRRVLPLLGGVDLSPMVVLIALQVLSMALEYWQLIVLR